MDRHEFDSVVAGNLVYVHDPMPPGHALLLGDVVRTHVTPRVLAVYLPDLDRTMFAEPDRVHAHPLRDEDQRACPWCRLGALTGGGHS
ncbi:MAG: hypothetical protein DLM67_16800 [Candidatus Nephthysia bennettiae]|uniref:HIT domain-containing protein n=1 Tax=Candidatus Nephthysia bennettiae TaxID=3127016 RepID=A0A934N5F8_9BACT|nr:hypothetical protein [Candidatus Dormibacteraeota bacterium]MBJ7612688.1 hypothetical protein [Candidatus Dormibacteraeota bacterium]PZR91143.1 MAG: hypothetical protein DLM67_16800 [Candidatus Dormibacteraeota bacterium]